MKDVVGEGGRTVVCKGSHGPTMSQSNIEPGGRGDVPREERKKKRKKVHCSQQPGVGDYFEFSEVGTLSGRQGQ